MKKQKMSTKEYIQHLENEEKRCQIRALASDDPEVRREQRAKELKTRERRKRLHKLWSGVNTAALRISAQDDRAI